MRLLRGLAISMSVLMVAIFLVLAFKRLHFPFDLEWVEDGNLLEVTRVTQHLPLYAAPTVEYAPFIYAPLYFWVSAQMAHLVGLGFPALRLVSICSTLGVFGCIYALVYGEAPAASGARGLSATLGVGFFASLFLVSGGFYDLGRVDMLCLFFTGLALVAGRRGQPVLAALLWTLALQTKQGVLPVAVLALCFEWQRPRRLLAGLGSFVVFAAGSIAWLNHASGGWYARYVFGIAGGFAILWREVVLFFPIEVFEPLALAILLIVAGVSFAPPAWRTSATQFYLFSGVGMVLFTFYVRVHAGASANAGMPAHLWVSIVAAICFERLYRLLAADGATQTRPLVLLLFAAVLQVAAHLYHFGDYVPNAGELRARQAFLEQVQSIPGEVLIFDHPEYSRLAGRRVYADGEAIEALINAKKLPYAAPLLARYADLVHARRFSAIVLNVDDAAAAPDWLPADYRAYYPVRVEAAGADLRRFTSVPRIVRMPCGSPTTVNPRVMFPGLLVDDSMCTSATAAVYAPR